MKMFEVKFEVITTQQDGTKCRVVHKEFDFWGDALEYANEIGDDIRTVTCSIYKHIDSKAFLVMDVV
jgi:hypothetical protein